MSLFFADDLRHYDIRDDVDQVVHEHSFGGSKSRRRLSLGIRSNNGQRLNSEYLVQQAWYCKQSFRVLAGIDQDTIDISNESHFDQITVACKGFAVTLKG